MNNDSNKLKTEKIWIIKTYFHAKYYYNISYTKLSHKLILLIQIRVRSKWNLWSGEKKH